jgi:hypothetical protein
MKEKLGNATMSGPFNALKETLISSIFFLIVHGSSSRKPKFE